MFTVNITAIFQILGVPFKMVKNVLFARKALSLRIADKYYPLIETTRQLCAEASRVTQNNISNLMFVNSLLGRFEKQIIDIPNDGGPYDIRNEEIRRCFSQRAVECIEKMMHAAFKVNCEVKNPNCWQYVRSDVVKLQSAIMLLQWDELVAIMAMKMMMRKTNLQRDFAERAEGL